MIQVCDRCTKAPATTHMEYRESCDRRNQVTSRCADCAKNLRGYINSVRGFSLVIDRPLETAAAAESFNPTPKES